MDGQTREESIWHKNLAAAAADSEQGRILQECHRRFRSMAYSPKECEDGWLDLYCRSEGMGQRLLYEGQPKQRTLDLAKALDIRANPGEMILLLGFGLGYPVREILARIHETGSLLVIEPDPLAFYSTFLYLDLSDILRDKRVSFIVGLKPDRAVEAIGSQHGWIRFSALPHRFLLHPPTIRIHSAYTWTLQQTWVDALSRESMYRASRTEHGVEVVRHTVANIGALVREPGVVTLFGQFQGIPAIQVGAGPSLNEYIETMRRAESKTLLVCVNAAYKILRKHGIEPHIVLCLDHQEENWNCFADQMPDPGTYLIADPRIDPRIVDLFRGRTFFISWHSTTERLGEPQPIDSIPLAKHGGNAVYQWLQKWIGEKGAVTGTGSVAVAGFQILARMGCTPVILVGQDLAFPGSRTYAQGTIYDNPSVKRDAQATRSVPSTDGGWVDTSETLNLYRLLLEHEIKRFGIPVINTSPAGAMIAGTSVRQLGGTFADLNPIPIDVSRRLAELYSMSVPKWEGGLVDNLDKEIGRMSSLLEVFADSAGEAEQKVGAMTADEAEKELQRVIGENHEAFDFLNDLLQECHVRYQELRCRLQAETDPAKREEMRIRSVREVFAAFEKWGRMSIKN
ncbi:MAG TPA: DUF115 domain-containing protein [bacterium]|nr:DUF115 domain-containing protein [bacterium]